MSAARMPAAFRAVRPPRARGLLLAAAALLALQIVTPSQVGIAQVDSWYVPHWWSTPTYTGYSERIALIPITQSAGYTIWLLVWIGVMIWLAQRPLTPRPGKRRHVVDVIGMIVAVLMVLAGLWALLDLEHGVWTGWLGIPIGVLMFLGLRAAVVPGPMAAPQQGAPGVPPQGAPAASPQGWQTAPVPPQQHGGPSQQGWSGAQSGVAPQQGWSGGQPSSSSPPPPSAPSSGAAAPPLPSASGGPVAPPGAPPGAATSGPTSVPPSGPSSGAA